MTRKCAICVQILKKRRPAGVYVYTYALLNFDQPEKSTGWDNPPNITHWVQKVTSKKNFIYLCLQDLFIDLKNQKCEKNSIFRTHENPPPLRFSKLEVFRRIQIYKFLCSYVNQKFFTFYIDMHTLGTKKNHKKHDIAIKKW